MAIELSKKFKPLWTSQCNYFIITGGRGSGKSFAVGDFIENLTFEQGHTILFTRYTMTSAHISVIPEFQEKIELENHTEHFKINKTDIENVKTGCKIIFKGLKTGSKTQTASLKSIQNVTTWVLDEAEEQTDEEEFDKIDESIRKKAIQNRVILLLNPTTKEHFIYRKFFEEMGVEEGFNGEKGNVCYIHTTYLDNLKNLSQKFIDKANNLKLSNLIKYTHRMLGGWLNAAEGVIFENWKYGEFDESLPFGYGLDFGFFPDPDVLVKVAIDNKRKKIYVKEEFNDNNSGLDKLYDNIIKTADTTKTIIADSAEKRLIHDLRNKGLRGLRRVVKTAGSILEGIKIMLDYEIIVDPTSTNIGTELNNYKWADKKNSVPIDDYNHRMDAIRYYCMTYIRKTNSLW